MRETTKLRELLSSPRLEFAMEAHNGLTAKIVEEAGFKSIWASGLAIAASLGLRDNNEATWTQVLAIAEFMSDACDVPILLDGDTGYGNFNNARRLVKKLEQRGIGGVCIEDKLFPKMNSFVPDHRQPLANTQEFAGKIRAMKDSQNDPDFVVIARLEALIAGHGMDEALERAEAYRQAGADAVLVHSKRSDCKEVASFIKAWGQRLPVVLVPTTYTSTPTKVFRTLGVSLIIWANHNLRSAIKSMQQTCKQVHDEESVEHIESDIASIQEVFRLQNLDELIAAEKRYLPSASRGQ